MTLSHARPTLTLRDRVRESVQLSRDLADHLERNFMPKAHELRRLCRPHESGYESSRVEDLTVRNHVAKVMDSDIYTSQLAEELTKHLGQIREEVSRMTGLA